MHRFAPSPPVPFDPRPPLAAYDLHHVGQVAGALPTPLRDPHKPEPFGVPKRVLDGAPAYSGPSGNLVNAPVASAPVPVLVSDDAQHGHLGRSECGGQRGWQGSAIGEPAATLA